MLSVAALATVMLPAPVPPKFVRVRGPRRARSRNSQGSAPALPMYVVRLRVSVALSKPALRLTLPLVATIAPRTVMLSPAVTLMLLPVIPAAEPDTPEINPEPPLPPTPATSVADPVAAMAALTSTAPPAPPCPP